MLLRRYHNKEAEVLEEKGEVVLKNLTVPELKEEAKHRDIIGYSNMKKSELIEVLEGD